MAVGAPDLTLFKFLQNGLPTTPTLKHAAYPASFLFPTDMIGVKNDRIPLPAVNTGMLKKPVRVLLPKSPSVGYCATLI